MKIAEFIDAALEPFAPRFVRQRIAERQALQLQRDYDIARGGRRGGGGWSRTGSSADREGRKALTRTRNAGYDLVRNNKYAAAIDIQMTASLVGDGIAPRAVHRNKAVQKRAQAEIDAFFRSRVDGRRDMFGVQKLATSGMVVGGETFIVWTPDDDGPDGRVRVLEGAFCDHNKNREATDTQNAIVQGVEFDRVSGDRCAYWLFDRHPGDGYGASLQSRRIDAKHVDHLYEERRPGQTRGISWLATVAPTLQDIADTEDAKLMKEKIAACLALVLTSEAGGPPIDPFAAESGEVSTQQAAGPKGKDLRIRPGLVMHARSGEKATVVNPPPSGEGVQMIKQQLMGVAASTIPYHMLTGDPSQANFSALKATTNPFLSRVDDVQQNILVAFMCEPAAARRMARLALRTGDRRFREVTWAWGMPVKRSNDPIRDFTGELMEIRAGTKSMVRALTERGLNPEEHVAEIQAWYALADAAGFAFDSDPRRVNLAGALQPAAGYLAGQPNKED